MQTNEMCMLGTSIHNGVAAVFRYVSRSYLSLFTHCTIAGRRPARRTQYQTKKEPTNNRTSTIYEISCWLGLTNNHIVFIL